MSLSTKVDRVIGAILPGWQRARTAERWRTQVIEHGMGLLGGHQEQRGYAGASVGDRNSTWLTPNSGANWEVRNSIDRLRARSRDLVRNEGWPSVAVRRIVSNAIGDGLRCAVDHPEPELKQRAQELWNLWAETTECDADGRLDFAGLQCLALRAVVEGGDALARRRWRRFTDGGALPFQVQLLEGEFLDTTRETMGFDDRGKRCVRGIWFDARGRRIGYQLFREHPGEMLWSAGLDSTFVPADSVAHAYRLDRPGQVSGVPWGSPVLMAVRMLGNWKDATLYRLQAAACLVAIVTGEDPDDAPAAPITPGNATGYQPEVLNPGAILYPRNASNVTFSNPPGVQGMDHFAWFTVLEVAAAYGVPYEVLTGDLSKTNYSSGRMGWLEFARELKVWRRDVMVHGFCNPAFRWFLEAAVVAGLLPDDARFRATWTASRREFVDAEKEIKGIVAGIRGGLSTWSEEARAQGWSPEELLAEYAADLKLFDAAGVPLECDPRRAAANAPTPSKSSAEDSPDDSKKSSPNKPNSEDGED